MIKKLKKKIDKFLLTIILKLKQRISEQNKIIEKYKTNEKEYIDLISSLKSELRIAKIEIDNLRETKL